MKAITYALFFVFLLIPTAIAVNVGSGLTPDIRSEDFVPEIWLCDSRVVSDDATEPGRMSFDGEPLFERTQNYAFEGEQISWTVLVMDKNGIQKIKDVFVSVGPHRGARQWVSYNYNDVSCMNDCASDYNICESNCNINGTNQTCVSACADERTVCESSCVRTGQRLEHNNIEANCVETHADQNFPSCNARILEEKLQGFDRFTMKYYECTLTVETPLSMYGENFVTLEVEDIDGIYNYADEVEYWFLNPVIALSVDGDLIFNEVRPGTSSYSRSVLVGNDADDGSGVLMDMFITGTDFYDSSSSGAACPTTNQLALSGPPSGSLENTGIRYWAALGAYSSSVDPRSDSEGYLPINYGIGFNDPKPFYNYAEILQVQDVGPYYAANVLTPGSEIALTFRLNLPEPCNGDFDTGSIFFWGEAI